MVQTTFNAGTSADITTILGEISVGGTDAAVDTAYTITITAGIDIANASATLAAGSSVTLEGSYPFIASSLSMTGTIETNLNFTGTLTLDNGLLTNPAITVSGGTVLAGLFTGTVLGTTGDGGDTAINNGTIASNGAFAAVEFDTGSVQNGWNGSPAALISGVPGGVDFQTSGLLQNGGTIIASGPGSTAVFIGAGTVDNGQISDTTALISGGSGVDIAGASVLDNDGTIIGGTYGGVYLGAGSVTNGQLGATSALIQGAAYGAWIGTVAGAGTVTNFGSIIGASSEGVFLQSGGTLTNGVATDTTALISGGYDGALFSAAGTVLNYATIQAIGSSGTQSVIGVFLAGGGTVENLTPQALIAGHAWGAVIEGGAGYVSNLGTIQATAASGLGVDLTAGGTIVNGSSTDTTAMILGGTNATADGVRIAAGTVGSGALVVNSGTIEGAVGVDFQSGATKAAGTLINNGLVEGSSGNAVVFGTGNELLVLQSAGAFAGSVLGATAPGSNTTLELASGTAGTLSAIAANSGTVSDSAGSFSFSFVETIAVDPTASWSIAGPGTLGTWNNAGTIDFTGGTVTLSQFVNGGLLEVQNNATATIAGTLISGSGQIQLSTDGDLVLDVTSIPTTQTVVFADAATLEVGAISGFNGLIQGFASDDQIIVDTTIAATFAQNGSLISVINSGSTLGVLTFSSVADANTAFNTPNALVDRICFLAGTMITTPSGDREVEQLSIGDLVLTASGAARPITWIGTGQVLATRGRRGPATPVIVRKGALGPGLPNADLRVTKGHSLWLDGALIPVEFLVNHRSIVWDDRAQEVTIYHIELETHDVILANGAPAESYRDDGNRWLFRNANLGWGQAPKPPYAPVLTGGPVVDAVWARLLKRAGPRKLLRLTNDADVHLLVDGTRVDAIEHRDGIHVFRLGTKPRSVRIRSRAAAPQELGLARDPRILGVAIRRIVLAQPKRQCVVEAVELTEGCHEFEPKRSLRWTSGDAVVPAKLFAGMNGPGLMMLHLGASTQYINDAAPRFATSAVA